MSGDEENNTSEGRSDRICEQRKNKVSQRKEMERDFWEARLHAAILF